MAGAGIANVLFDRGTLDRFWRYARPLAVAGTLVSGLLVAGTYLPTPLIVPRWLRLPVFAGVFPLHLLVVLTLLAAGIRNPANLLRAIPLGARIVLGAFVLAMWLVAMVSVFGRFGEPERHDGRYYSNLRGELTELSYDEYRDLQRVHQRRFTAVPAAFYAAGLAVAVAYPKMVDRRLAPPAPPLVDRWPPPPPPPPPAPGHPTWPP